METAGNTGARPSEQPTYPLYAMDPDQARHHAQILRAVADLLLAREPACFVQSSYPDGKYGITVIFDELELRHAIIRVRNRVAEGDEDYAIKVERREDGGGWYPSRYRRRR